MFASEFLPLVSLLSLLIIPCFLDSEGQSSSSHGNNGQEYFPECAALTYYSRMFSSTEVLGHIHSYAYGDTCGSMGLKLDTSGGLYDFALSGDLVE